MPWPAKGDYYSFKEEAIKLRTPPVSGVYGLYNLKHHILIGQSSNIREALLHHRRKTKFRFRRLQPTGFTFEACPAELREFRARQLVWEYQPVLRSDDTIGLAAWWRSWTTHSARAFPPKVDAGVQAAKPHPKPMPKAVAEKNPAENAGVDRDRFALASTSLALIIVAVALFVLLAENKSVGEIWTRQVLSLAARFTDIAQQSSFIAAPAQTLQRATANDAIMPAAKPQPEQQLAGADHALEPAGAATAPLPLPPAAAGKDKMDAAAATSHGAPARAQSHGKADSLPLWTVQAMATTDKGDAKAWLDRLKAKGFDAYVVEAEIKGQSWFRVRVGNLSSRQEAEALGKTLRSQEGFHDAFIAQSSEEEVILAANSR